MSDNIRYKRPAKSWGMQRIDLTINVTPGEYEALKHHAENASKVSGIPVSVSNAIVTTMKQVHDDIREEAELIDKEWKKNGRNYTKRAKKLGSTAQG